MNAIKHPKSLGLVAVGALVALVALAGPASAGWHDGNRYDNGWRGHDHYNGYYYRAPPVVYSTPYNNTPGFTIRLQ